MELDGVALEQVIDSCQPYLNERQPQKLQEVGSIFWVLSFFVDHFLKIPKSKFLMKHLDILFQ